MSESTDQKDDALSRAEGRDLSHEKVLVVVKKQQEVIDQLKSQNTELQAEKKKMIVLLKRLDEKNKAELEKFREKENQANDDLQAMMVAIEKTQNQKIELMEKLEVSERELRVCKEKLEMKSLESAELSKNYDEIAEKFSSQGERIVTLETELSLSQAKNIELLSDIDGRESKTPKISLDCEEIEKLRNELSKTRSEKAASDAEVQNLNTLFEQLKISLGNPKSVDLLNAVEHLKSRAINAESFEKKVLSLEKEKSSVQTEFKELHESTARLQSRVDELSLSKSTVNNVDENIVQKLTLQVEELKSQVELQSKTILELEDKENRISNILSLAEIEKTSLRVSKDNLELALVDYHLKLSISEKETSVLKQAFISLSDELSEFRLSLQNELDELSKKNYDSRNSHSEGENSFISYQEKVSKLEDELKSCIKLSNDRLHQLNQHECELKLLKKKNENLLTESENIKVTELEISKLKSENSDLSAIIGSLQTEVQQLRTNTEVIKGQLEEFETEKLHLLEKISSLEFTISEDLKKFNELSLVKKIQDEKNTSEILHYKLTVDKLQVEQSEKTKEISQLLMELSTLKDQIAVVQSSISEKDLIIKNLMTLESDYKSSLNDLESSSKRESALIKEIESLKADLKQSQEKNNSMHHESGPPMMKRLENENSDLRNNLKLAEEKAVESVSLNNKLSLELAEYESSLSHIKAENESYKQKLTSMESLNNEVDSYKQEIIELRKTNEALLNDISTLHETVKQSSMRKEGDMSHREKLQMLQKKYESTLLELENERTHVAEATALLVDEKGNVASLKSKLEDYVARVDEDQSRIQALNKSLSNMKQSLEQAQKEKAELIAQKEILLKEGKKLKALLLRTNKHLEEMKKTMAQDQTHISALKAAECSLDSIRTEMQSHWLIDPTRVSEEVISSIDSYSVLHRIYLQGKWWYLVKFEYSESSKNTNTLPSNIDSSCQDSTTLSNNYESIIFWTSANVFKQKLGIGNSIEDSDSNSSEVVLAGKLKIPIPVHTAMERSLKEKFDKNWKTAAAKYEDLVKDLQAQVVARNETLRAVEDEYSKYKSRVHSVVTQQSTELDQLKSQKEHDLSLSVQNEELKRKIASLEAAVHQFDGANQKVIVLEKEKQSLMLLVEEITEKMQHSDSQWLVKLQNSQLKMEELLQQHKNELAALKMKYTEQVNAARQELKEHRAKALVLLEEKDKEIKELTTKLMTNPSESLIDPRPSEDSTSSVEEKTFTQVHEADSGVSLMVNVPESPAAVNQHINAEEVVKMKDHVRKLQNLLRESEIRLSEEQHKVDEMRSQLQNSERSKRRSQLNIDYLKNVLVGFMENPSEESLIPVLSRLLELTPQEVSRIESKRSSHKSAGSSSMFSLW